MIILLFITLQYVPCTLSQFFNSEVLVFVQFDHFVHLAFVILLIINFLSLSFCLFTKLVSIFIQSFFFTSIFIHDLFSDHYSLSLFLKFFILVFVCSFFIQNSHFLVIFWIPDLITLCFFLRASYSHLLLQTFKLNVHSLRSCFVLLIFKFLSLRLIFLFFHLVQTTKNISAPSSKDFICQNYSHLDTQIQSQKKVQSSESMMIFTYQDYSP